MMRKFKNKTLPRGILIDRGYVYIRIFPNGQKVLKSIGPLSQNGVIDDAISKLNLYREQIRAGKFGTGGICAGEFGKPHDGARHIGIAQARA